MMTERFAIQQRMADIKEERRALNDEYYKLMDRLRQLDADQHSTSSADFMKITEELTKAVQTVASIVPPVKAHEVIEHIKREHNAEDHIIHTKREVESPLAAEMRTAGVNIDAQEDHIQHLLPLEAEPMIVSIMKENGMAMKAADIRKEMISRGYDTKTPVSEILRKGMASGRFVRASFGEYLLPEMEQPQLELDEAAAAIEE